MRLSRGSPLLCGPFGEGLDKIRGDAGTFFVIVTRGHRYDQICLESIAKKKHAYIGMMGSRYRTFAPDNDRQYFWFCGICFIQNCMQDFFGKTAVLRFIFYLDNLCCYGHRDFFRCL